MSRTLKLTLAYDGTGLVGWQRQAAGVSIQGLLEECLARIEGHAVIVTGAGRTDAGVHALGQVAGTRLDHPIPAGELQRALNAMLPPEVRVRGVEEAPDDFHARYSARGKTYRYAILQGEGSPFLCRYAWHVSQPLDSTAMADAARLLEGEHDFAAFRSTGSEVKSTRRTVVSSTVRAAAFEEAGLAWLAGAGGPGGGGGELLTFEITGDGFLRHMVRAIVGSLVEVGAGRHGAAWMEELLRSGRREDAGPTAPAHGLWLVSVRY